MTAARSTLNKLFPDQGRRKMIYDVYNSGPEKLRELGDEFAGMSSGQREQDLIASQQMANLALQQGGQQFGQGLGALDAMGQARMEPSQWGYDIWTANQRAPKSGGAGPYIMGGIGAGLSALGGIPGMGGGGGQQGYMGSGQWGYK